MSNIISGYTILKKADFTIVNSAGGNTLTDRCNGIECSGSDAGYTLLLKSLPTVPYSFTAHITPYPIVNPVSNPYYNHGICLRNSGTGYVTALQIVYNSNITNSYCAVSRFPGGGELNNTAMMCINWFRCVDNNVNRLWYLSRDGINWKQFYSQSRTDWQTPDQIGIYVNSSYTLGGNNKLVACVADHFKVDYADA